MSSGQPNTYMSKRDTASSGRSTTSGTSRSERASKQQANPAVESAVTRLLVAIKQLLESLTSWSNGNATETQVSDVYVRLGNDFNAAVAAFAGFGIDMTELMSVPDDLRAILEQCLAEDATPENLEVYLPDVRRTITNLLQGLRGKQSMYRRLVAADTKPPSERPESRSSSRTEGSGSSRRSRTPAPDSDGASRRSTTSSRRKESTSGMPQQGRSHSNGNEQFVGGFSIPPPQDAQPVPQRSSTPAAPRSQTPKPNGHLPTRSTSASAVPPPTEQPPPRPPPPQEVAPAPAPQPPSSVVSPVPKHVTRYSLSDSPVPFTPPPPPAVVIDEATPSSDDTPIAQSPPAPSSLDDSDTQAPAIENSLAALKKNDVLERRASKRFSTYTFSKMAGGSIRERPGGNNRVSLAVSSNLNPGDLAVLTENDDRIIASPSPSKRDRTRGSGRVRATPSVIMEDDEAPPVPPLPPGSRDASPQKQPPQLPHDIKVEVRSAAATSLPAPPAEQSPRSATVFLQVGNQVKRSTIEPGISFSSLRVLFVDKFSYSPGKDNFPAIYIQDPSTHVRYELEDVDEIKEGSVLSLNIEPLDQIKQHIDTQISSLSQDIKDLRAFVSTNNRRNSMQPPPMIIGQPLSESTPARPSERTFRSVARTISRLLPTDDRTPTKEEPSQPLSKGIPEPPPPLIVPQMTGMSVQPQMTGASVMTEYSTRVVNDLKTQFDEVQNLRRDLGIMRQLYSEFMKQTKESLGTLRTQTQTVRQLANSKVGGSRAYINDGKAKLDTRSQNVLTKMEELQDTVENIKDDVLRRNVSPRPQILRAAKGDLTKITTELQSLKEHIQTVKPMWKKTWEEELQNIVEEQQFLGHQEELLTDLLEDRKAVDEVYGHVEKVISLRGASANKVVRTGRGFKPPPPEEGHTGLGTVMLEIKGAQVDPDRRLKAILANEKQREKDLASKSDEFQAELTGFVSGKRLKMTGGAEEADRVRQKRSENTLKAMFGSSPNSAVASPSISADALPSPTTP